MYLVIENSILWAPTVFRCSLLLSTDYVMMVRAILKEQLKLPKCSLPFLLSLCFPDGQYLQTCSSVDSAGKGQLISISFVITQMPYSRLFLNIFVYCIGQMREIQEAHKSVDEGGEEGKETDINWVSSILRNNTFWLFYLIFSPKQHRGNDYFCLTDNDSRLFTYLCRSHRW